MYSDGEVPSDRSLVYVDELSDADQKERRMAPGNEYKEGPYRSASVSVWKGNTGKYAPDEAVIDIQPASSAHPHRGD
ncbi:hypothetical protein A0H81_12029 [Grifola frondosa]|uniref:Uncharacterized protein n=1 Tax=Grifola frondosa TaxID=5627 RepID=A0A1C7LUA0_GRIFR|nr:hypothetical protein A0H81_12029 [Grifola frondosa]